MFCFLKACETQTEIIIINHKDNPFSSETKNQVVEKFAKISYLNNNKNDTSVKLLFTKISESMYYNLKEKKITCEKNNKFRAGKCLKL